MAIDVVMPRLSDSMEQGTILRWLKTDGDPVRRGEELAEIETDKATETYAAEAEGVLRIVAGEGATLPVGGVIATIGQAAAPAPALPEAAASAPVAGAGTVKGDVRVEELTRPQQVLARRVAESRAIVPDLVLRADADMGAWVAERGPGASYEDALVRAVGLALRETPRANAAYRDGHAEVYSRVNVAVAVAAGGAIVHPTIFDADRKPLPDVARELGALAERARAGALTAPEVGGATFTVASLAAYDIDEVVPVINAPQAGIVGAGAVRETPVVRDGAVVPGHRATLTLVCDHRILYGAAAAALLARVRALLEDPAALAG